MALKILMLGESGRSYQRRSDRKIVSHLGFFNQHYDDGKHENLLALIKPSAGL